MKNYINYKKYYKEDTLFDKIQKVATSAGLNVIYAALILYYLSISPNVPFKDKLKIYGALGYFILPVDLIPDFLPAGYTDDFAALVYALNSLWYYITPDMKSDAIETLHRWFGDFDESSIKI